MRAWTASTSGLVLAGFLLVTAGCALAADAGTADGQSTAQPAEQTGRQNMTPDYAVTPAVGPSWVHLLGIFNLSFTPMGQMGNGGPPPPSPRIEPELPTSAIPPAGGMGMGGMMGGGYAGPQYSPAEMRRLMAEKFTLAGSDFYRLDCRSCHGPEGNGAPPEIHSLIDPVQATSAAILEERMKKKGRPIGAQMAKEMASQAEQSILERLQKGGKEMPPFRHLEGKEVDALMRYLKMLAGAAEAQAKPILVTEPIARAGEHLVKGTCQICHDASGPGIRGGGMMRGIIPSLASFPYEQSIPGVIWQVEAGSRQMMMMGGNRMPAYPYITPQEAAAAYVYLVQYPPF